MNAPICVAKGVGALALRIREVAGFKHGVPVIENPPLARVLHATVEIDQEIRPEHYKAVAEVIGYVMKLKAGVPRAVTSCGVDRVGHSMRLLIRPGCSCPICNDGALDR